MIFLKQTLKHTLFFVVCLLPSVTFAQNASLSIRPDTGVFPIGEPFTISVRIDTGGNEVGTADATISYNPEDVSYVAVSDEGSIFNTLLVDSTREPGGVDISGFVERGQQPYSGRDGLFATITFIPLRNTATQVILKNTGATPPLQLGASVGDLGNVLSSINNATYTFVPKESTPAAVLYASAEETFEIELLPAPVEDWFGTTTVKVSWTLPEGVTEMRTLVSGNPEDEPTEIYQVPVSSVTLDTLEEGMNYFLLQFNFGGEWGSVIRKQLKVDLSGPSYVQIKEAEREDGSDPRVSFSIEASDTYSGVAEFEMSIDGDTPIAWERPANGIYRPEGVSPGEHVLMVTAFDKVGNSTSSDYVFSVRSLEPPVLDSSCVPDRVLTGDIITVCGTTYPNAEVTAFISHNEGEALERKVTSDESGKFVINISDGAKAGVYTTWYSVVDERGGASPNSIKRSIEVTQPVIMLFGMRATYMAVIAPLLIAIVLLALIVWLGYTWLHGYRTRVKRETSEVYQTTKQEFNRLRKELIKQIGMLEKANQYRELTKEEMRIFSDLSKRLDNMERHISQEIEDIEVIEEEEMQEVVSTTKGALDKYRDKLERGQKIYEETHTIRLK